jgi:hypothetical protein
MNRLNMACVLLMLGVYAGSANATDVPLIDRENLPVPATIDGKTPTIWDVKRAILRGALKRGWRPIVDAPGSVRLQFEGRYEAQVEVSFDLARYGIKHVSVSGMGFQHRDVARYELNIQRMIRTINLAMGIPYVRGKKDDESSAREEDEDE